MSRFNPSPFRELQQIQVNVQDFGPVFTSDDTATIQNAINYVQNAGGGTVFFPAGTYKIASTLQITQRYVKLKGEGNSVTFLNNAQNGVMIALGTDDGNYTDYSAGGYQGSFYMEAFKINNTIATYPNATAIKDWGGGSVYFKDVMFNQFDTAFYGINSDVNHFVDVTVGNGNKGFVLTARSDQNTFDKLYAYEMNNAVIIENTLGTVFNHPVFVLNHQQDVVIYQLSTDPEGASDNQRGYTTFYSPWFENYSTTDTTKTCFIEIGVQGDKKVSDISLYDSLWLNDPSNPSVSFINCDKAQNVNIYAPKFNSIGGSKPFINTTANTLRLSAIDADFSHWASFSAFIAGAGNNAQSNHVVSRYGETYFGSNGRWHFIDANGDDFRLQANTNANTNKPYLLLTVNGNNNLDYIGYVRQAYGTSAPGGAAPDGGNWNVGDRVWNTSPVASGTMGWVCVTAGSPGTWKTFGTIGA